MIDKNRIGALVLAKSKSTLNDKNIRKILNRPLMAYPMLAAINTNLISNLYVSSDSDTYLKIGSDFGFNSIKRPIELSQDDSKSDDAVLHAINNTPELNQCDIIIVLHANVGTIYPELIQNAIEILNSNPEITSVVPAHINNEYNPYRCFFSEKGKFLIPSIKNTVGVSPNRQDLPKAYFLDHSFWCIRRANLDKTFSFCPWNSLGDKIFPILTQGMFDVHSEDDFEKTEKWIKENNNKLNYLFNDNSEGVSK